LLGSLFMTLTLPRVHATIALNEFPKRFSRGEIYEQR
jgi:hypothetical protein